MSDPIIRCANFLRDHLEWFRHREEVDEFLSDVERCARVVRGLARGPHEQKYLGPCGAVATHRGLCDPGLVGVCHADDFTEDCACWCHLGRAPEICEGDVYGPRGGSVGRCRVCGAEVATADREAWLDALTRSEAFTAADIEDAYGINAKTIRTWANRARAGATEPPLRTYWRNHAGLVLPWSKQAEELKADRLHYAGDVLDLATAAAVERAEREAARARRREDAA